MAMMDQETQRRLQREYFESRIRSAHPIEIVTMLYQAAIDNLNAAVGHLKTGDRRARSRAVSKAQEAVHELLVALDHSVGADFTHTLASLYRFCLDRMVTGHSQQSAKPFEEALSVLSTLAVAWREIKERMCDAPADSAVPMPAEEPRRTVNQPYSRYRPEPEMVGSRGWSC